jgi:hypothetical protein
MTYADAEYNFGPYYVSARAVIMLKVLFPKYLVFDDYN